MKINLSLLFLCLLGACATSKSVSNARPTREIDHVLYLIFDQMRPDYVDRYHLKNFKRLRDRSQNYTNAYVGYLGSETVVSHAAFQTGLKPKFLPWQDDVFWDQKGLLGKPNEFYSSGGFTFDQFGTLLSSLPKDTFLTDFIHRELGGKVFAVGEKHYATYLFGSPYADSIITLKKQNGVCVPDGVRVPSYIFLNNRFTLQCSETYGTDKTYYALDGNHYVPGHDAEHLGGDVWVNDVAKKIIAKEDWSGLFLTFGAIDKVSHMLGEEEGTRPKETKNIKTEYTLPEILKVADQELGSLLDLLQEKNLLERTLIVLTADHGGQSNYHYLGNGKTGKWGALKNESAKDAPHWVKHISDPAHVAFSWQDSAIRIWLKEGANAELVSKKIKDIPEVTEIYAKRNDQGTYSYERKFERLKTQPKKFQAWAKAYSKELLDSMATSNSPDLVGLLTDHTGFDLIGEHGGAQESAQRIPLYLSIPQKTAKTFNTPIRIYEIKEKILEYLK